MNEERKLCIEEASRDLSYLWKYLNDKALGEVHFSISWPCWSVYNQEYTTCAFAFSYQVLVYEEMVSYIVDYVCRFLIPLFKGKTTENNFDSDDGFCHFKCSDIPNGFILKIYVPISFIRNLVKRTTVSELLESLPAVMVEELLVGVSSQIPKF